MEAYVVWSSQDDAGRGGLLSAPTSGLRQRVQSEDAHAPLELLQPGQTSKVMV